MTAKRILIVGGGFAGMYAAMEMRRLADAGHQVTLVSAENFMQYQPFLPEVASGTIDPRAIVVPLRPLLNRATIEVGEVMTIDHDARAVDVQIPDGGIVRLEYDILVVTAGSWSRVLPIPGLAEHGIGFKTVQEAIYLRNHVLSRLDVATQTQDPALRQAALTFVFVGAGYAGVEAMGELEDLARDAMRNYPALRPSEMRWVLVDAAGQILPELPSDLAVYGQARLEERHIDVLLHTRLESAEDGTIRLSDGQVFAADTLVWTAGVKPSPLAGTGGFPVDEHGRIVVDDHLRIVGLPDAWAAGDIAAVPDRTTGGLAPPTAQHAMREGRRLGRNITATILGGDLGGHSLSECPLAVALSRPCPSCREQVCAREPRARTTRSRSGRRRRRPPRSDGAEPLPAAVGAEFLMDTCGPERSEGFLTEGGLPPKPPSFQLSARGET